MSHRLAIFGWHNVGSSYCFPQPDGAGRRGLEQQLKWLCRCGTPVRLGDALAMLRAGGRLPPRAFAITFDDGYRDAAELAVPLLARLGVPATVFLVPGILSREVRAWWEHLAWAFEAATASALTWAGKTYELLSGDRRADAFSTIAETLKRCNREQRESAIAEIVGTLAPAGPPGDDSLFLDWEDAKALAAAGWEIGSHSRYHAILSQESAHLQRTDLRESRELLEQQLGTDVSLLSYPNGTRRDFDEITMGAAKEAGYEFAVTTVAGLNGRRSPPYMLRRYVMYPEQGAAYFRRIALDGLHELRDT